MSKTTEKIPKIDQKGLTFVGSMIRYLHECNEHSIYKKEKTMKVCERCGEDIDGKKDGDNLCDACGCDVLEFCQTAKART